MDHFSYFMLRLHRDGQPAPEPVVTGMAQQLSTGEKRAFTGAGELLDLLLHGGENKTVAAEEDSR